MTSNVRSRLKSLEARRGARRVSIWDVILGYRPFEDADEAYGALYGLVVSDWHLKMLLGEEAGEMKKGFGRKAEQAVAAFLTLYGTKR